MDIFRTMNAPDRNFTEADKGAISRAAREGVVEQLLELEAHARRLGMTATAETLRILSAHARLEINI